MTVSALIIEDHPLMRDAIRMTIESIMPDGRVDTAESFTEAGRRLQSGADWDFILLDLQLPDSANFDALVAIRELRPNSTAVVLSAHTDRDIILRCIDLGAAGYIPKTHPSAEINHALRQVFSGHLYLPPEVLEREPSPRTALPASQPDPFRRDTPGAREPAGPTPRSTDPRKLGLTERQCDVLRLILRGLPNKLICRQLDLAEGTVKVHVSAVLRALGVRNRTQAVIAASQIGLRIS